MGSFFRKDEEGKPKLEGKDSSVSSQDLKITGDAMAIEEDIITELSIHPEWQLPKEDEYAYRFLNLECPPLKPNQLSIAGISIMEEGQGKYRVNAFVRNSLDKILNFTETKLALFNEEGILLGRKLFDLSPMGDIPPKSSRPWSFVFTKKDLFKTEIPQEGWMLGFWVETEDTTHKLEIDKEWEEALADGAKETLIKFYKQLQPPKKGEINFQSVDAKVDDDGELQITILIRNGKDDNIKFQEIPLAVEDASGEIVAFGQFVLENFVVTANTSKPWTFIYPKQNMLKENIDFSSWKAFVPK